MKISFIGFGHFGSAVASVLRQNKNNEIVAWDVAKTGDVCQVEDVGEAVKDADIVFFAVPSAFFADCIKGIQNIPQDAVLVTGTKGIDDKSGKFPYELLEEAFPENEITVLSGPMLADELVKGIESCATLAAYDRKSFAKIISAFEDTSLKLCFSKDMQGVSLAGILKNVYTLAFGLSDGLGLGYNFKSCEVLQAIREMQAIISVLGGDPNTMMTHAGLGDLLATGYSEASRNYQYGLAVGKGGEAQKATVEGIDNIETVMRKLPDKNSFPLICAVEDIFVKNTDDKKARLLQAFRSC